MLIQIKKIYLLLALGFLVTLLGTGWMSVQSVSAAEAAYKSGQKIKYLNIVYSYAGKDTRASSAINGWSIYLPAGFVCGNDIIVDNPDTANTVALRGTKVSANQGNPVIGDCATVDINTQPTITTVTTQSLCEQVGGTWKTGNQGAGCVFTTLSTPSTPPAACGSVDSCDRKACITNGGVWDDAAVSCKTVDTEINVTDGNQAYFTKNDCTGSDNKAGESIESSDHCGILDYVINFTNLLSALVGIVVVGSIVYGGIQYSASSGDPQKVAAAKKRIVNSIFAFIFFIFMYSLIQYLVPGGVF